SARQDSADRSRPLLAAGLVCHIRATRASLVLLRLAEFGLYAGGHGVSEPVLSLVRGVQIDERGAAGRMAHALHQFAEVGPGLSAQDIPGVAQVVKVNVQAGHGEGGEPDAATEVWVPQ